MTRLAWIGPKRKIPTTRAAMSVSGQLPHVVAEQDSNRIPGTALRGRPGPLRLTSSILAQNVAPLNARMLAVSHAWNNKRGRSRRGVGKQSVGFLSDMVYGVCHLKFVVVGGIIENRECL